MTTAEAEEELVELEAEATKRKRDIKDAELTKAVGRDQRDFAFQDISDEDDRVVLYSMVDGCPISIPQWMLSKTLRKMLPSGQRAFTSQRNRTPSYKRGDVKCWLHPNHPRRAEWDAMGLAGLFCESEHLASAYSARIHMEHRHKQEYKAIQEFLETERRDEERNWMRAQAEATQRLAQAAQPTGLPKEGSK